MSNPGYDCEHKRYLNLETRRYVCEHCGVDWEGMKSKKTLYCAAFMVKTAQGWVGDMIYFHQDNIGEARLEFYRSEQRIVREVNIAPVVGWLANDDNADSVSA
jgi:hypothetical protein